MKAWLKKNWLYILGVFFVWVLPLITLVIMTWNKVESVKYLDLVGVLGIIIFMIVYNKKLKQVIRDKMLEAKLKDQKTWFWRIMNYIHFLLGFAIVFLLYDFGLEYLEEIEKFVIAFLVEGSVGYILLIIDGFNLSTTEIEESVSEETKTGD